MRGARERADHVGRHQGRGRKRAPQLELPFPKRNWGGRRAGAGRKPASGRKSVAHGARPVHRPSEPVHVTLRSALRSLRSQFVYPTVLGAIRAVNQRWYGRFGIVHFSVQADHVHLIIEAVDRRALSGGVRGLEVSLARRLNRLLFRRGRCGSDRWHQRALKTPRSVRRALVYVLANFKKHGEPISAPIDPCSSGPYFPEYVECRGKAPLELQPQLIPLQFRKGGPPVPEARSWLLRIGWLRWGRISFRETPRGEPPLVRHN
jgi:REP element-mobilizing transposase RayT